MTDQKKPTVEQMPNAELIERIGKCLTMIGNMCSEGRPPKMRIPAVHDEYNEDIYICDTLRLVRFALTEKQADVADTVPPAEYFFENDNWDITYHRGEHEDEAMVNAPPNEIVEFRLLKDVGAVYMVNLTDAEGNSEIREFANEELAKAALAAQREG